MGNIKSGNLSDTIYQYLLNMILSMEVKPGDRIPEAKIADLFGVSRTPIRDAMRMLANDGIITIYPNRFAEKEEAVEQIGVLRVQLDILATKLAVFNGANSEFANMLEHSKQCLKAALNGDSATRIKEDCEFHLALSEISKNKQLLATQKSVYLKIEFLQSWRANFLQEPEEQHLQHQEIYNALLERNSKKAIRLVTEHNMHFHDLEKKYPLSVFLDIS